MDRTDQMYWVVRNAFVGWNEVDVLKTRHRIDVEGQAGSHEGKHWRVVYTIKVDAPVLPQPSFLSAGGGGVFRPVEQTGDVPPAEVAEYARRMMIKLRNSTYEMAGLTELEVKMLMIIRNVADFAHGEELSGPLKAAVQDAREMSNRFFEDVTSPDYVDYRDEELPSGYKA